MRILSVVYLKFLVIANFALLLIDFFLTSNIRIFGVLRIEFSNDSKMGHFRIIRIIE